MQLPLFSEVKLTTDLPNYNLTVPYDRILEETRLKLAIAKQHLNALKNFGMTQQWINELEKKSK